MTTQKAAIETAEIQATETEFDFDIFGCRQTGEIYVPDDAVIVRNNCQSGRWQIGKKEYDGKGLQIAVVKYAKLRGSLGMTEDAMWGQIWFVAEAGELPLGMVMCTYVKSQGLSEFANQLSILGSQGIRAATGLFMPTFVKASSQKADESGVIKPINYYYLEWDWKPRQTPEEKARLEPLGRLVTAIKNNPLVRAKLVDVEGQSRLFPPELVISEPPALKSAEEVPALAPAQ